jgi:hypothetical protein
MDDFMKEEVEFQMPEDVRSWKQNSKIQVQGITAVKTTIRTLKMKDGSEKEVTKTETRTFVV